MKERCWILLKVLVKSSLDSYVLPGTLTGTEILLLYLTQWRRLLILLTIGTVHLIVLHAQLPQLRNVPNSATAKSE